MSKIYTETHIKQYMILSILVDTFFARILNA